MIAREKLKQDRVFQKACELAGLPSKFISESEEIRFSPIPGHMEQGLVRQYCKWLRKSGLAYSFRHEAQRLVGE